MTAKPQFTRFLPLTVVFLLSAACSDNGPSLTDDLTQVPGSPTTTAPTEGTVAPDGDLAVLPVRDGPREETTHGVPHVQVYAEPVPEINAQLHRRAFSLPGVEDRESEVSLPGARALWLADDVDLARPEVLQAGREFAHIHPNGSLHVWLPVRRAVEVAETKWGELHPWVGREDFWDGLVMIYTPESPDELDITVQLLVDAYNYVTGTDLDAAMFE